MKKSFKAAVFVIALAFVLCLVGFSGEADVARASEVETFLFSEEDGNFVVTRISTEDVIYRSYFDENEILSAIKGVVGDGAYDVVLSAPSVEIVLKTEGAKKPYSKDNLFLFRANASHGFEKLGIIGYRGADPSSGFEWRFSREGSAETVFGGHGMDMPFGASNAYGEYEIYAYATISLTFHGKTYYATGKAEAFAVEVEKSSADLPDVSEDALKVSSAYGKTIEEIVNEGNVASRNFALVVSDDKVKDTVLGVGTHGVELEYAVGTWNGDVFQKNESVNAVKLSLTIEIKPYNVYVMLHHVTVKEGDEINLTYEILAPTALPNKESIEDLKLNLYADNEGSEAGKYTIYGQCGNPNYKVYFNNYENRDNRDYSTWATLTIRPSNLVTEYEGIKYTLSRYDGFQYGDELVLVDAGDGAKTIKVYNDNESVAYTDMTLTIERISDGVDYVKIYENGTWKDVSFEGEGKYTTTYSTENAEVFKVVAVMKSVAPVNEGNETVAYALMAVFVAIFLAVAVPRMCRSRYPKDEYVRETKRPAESVEEASAEKTNQQEATLEDSIEQVVAEGEDGDTSHKPVKKERLTLEQKLALHPDFVPTLSLKDAFGEREEDEEDDDKDSEDVAEDGKITFRSKMLTASSENKAIYNALKNQILAYRGVKSRVVNGGDYFRRPGKQLIKIVFIGKTIRLALALDPKDYDYNLYHQKDRGAMKKYADTPMFIKVQSPLGVRRAFKLIADLMTKEGIKWNKKYLPDDYLYDLTYGEDEE